jgi:hypothetical protein
MRKVQLMVLLHVAVIDAHTIYNGMSLDILKHRFVMITDPRPGYPCPVW